MKCSSVPVSDMRSHKRPHTLFLVRNLPWPMTAGARLRDFQNIRILASYGRVSVISMHGAPTMPPSQISENVAAWKSLDTLLAEDPPPYPSYEEPLHPDWWMNTLGHPSDHLWYPFRHEALRRFVSRSTIDLAIVEDIGLWRYIPALNEHCDVILDCHNVQGDLDRELADGLPAAATELRRRLRMAAEHIEQVHKLVAVSGFIVCSQPDRERLLRLGADGRPVSVVHNTVDAGPRGEGLTSPPVSSLLRALTGERILFPGVMNYPPNHRAARDLVTKIFPLVLDRVPQASLIIVGKSPTSELMKLARPHPRVFLTGDVPDTQPYFDLADVMCVPLREGGGTRFKILEAFKYGVPVVTSRKGSEGLSVEHEREVLLAEEPEEHAESIVRVLGDAALRQRLTNCGTALLHKSHVPAVAAAQMKEVLSRYSPFVTATEVDGH